MSRKRDTNWSRDEIAVLLDSIMEITKTRANDGKRTNSREVFEYAAKKMGEKGHTGRAEREKCRTKWKKMKEEFTHAKRAREGDTRFKEAPGIQPFYTRMEQFINGNHDNISPHSTIVRRTSNISGGRPSSGMRTSARIAANSTNGTPPTTTTTTTSNDNSETNSTIAVKTSTNTDYSSIHTTPSNPNSSPRQNSRLSSSSTTNNSNNRDNSTSSSSISLSTSQAQPQAIPNGDLCTIYTTYSSNGTSNNNSTPNNVSNTSTNLMNAINNDSIYNHSNEQADISYRVSSGCRQITIFGDHDVDIKFRGDCVTINKIDVDIPITET